VISAAPHIFTLTGNLLAERTLTFDAWAPGRTQRATAESFQVGGKGINVAKMLARLGAHELRPMGSALTICLVAEGSADFYPRLGLTSEWDTAAAQAVRTSSGTVRPLARTFTFRVATSASFTSG
jgi:3'-phosphoadenosine 5'-phosphosulfate (PAPS) 3'-phosphatase